MATNELQLVGGRKYKAISCALQLLITKDYQVNKIAPNPPHTLSKRTVTLKIKLQPVRKLRPLTYRNQHCTLLKSSLSKLPPLRSSQYITECYSLKGFVISCYSWIIFCRCWEHEAWEHGSFKVYLCKEQTLPPPLDLRLISPLLLQIPCSMSVLILSYSYIKQSLVVHQQIHGCLLCDSK